jgi:type IV pilus assembly protein PilM
MSMAAKLPAGLADIANKLSGLLSGGGGGGTVIGLSIGTSSIKLVELKRSGKSWKLLHFGIVQLGEDTIINREIINQISVVDSIKQLLGQLKLSTKQVCTSLSGTSLIIKRMQVEVPNVRELQEAVFWEAEQYLPFDPSEVVMDYHMLSRAKDNKTDVLLVAVKKAVLDTYMACVEDAGLQPKIVDVDFFALQNLFEINYPANPSEAVAVVDLGASSLKLVVVHDGVPVYTKDAAIGGRMLTAEIQKSLGLNYNDAESLKTAPGGSASMPQEVSDLMHIMAENIAGEIKRSLDFYNASSTGAPVSYVLLTGGSAKIENISKMVEDMVGLPTQLLNPFSAITCDPSVFTPDYLNAIAPIAAVPIGLALRAGSK